MSAFSKPLSILSHLFDLSEATRRHSVACRKASLRLPCALIFWRSDGARFEIFGGVS